MINVVLNTSLNRLGKSNIIHFLNLSHMDWRQPRRRCVHFGSSIHGASCHIFWLITRIMFTQIQTTLISVFRRPNFYTLYDYLFVFRVMFFALKKNISFIIVVPVAICLQTCLKIVFSVFCFSDAVPLRILRIPLTGFFRITWFAVVVKPVRPRAVDRKGSIDFFLATNFASF